MKNFLLSVFSLVICSVAIAQKKPDDVAKFATEVINMGKLPQNIPAKVTFRLTNISKEPLIIEDAKPTCGCTIGNYTKEPIMPGKQGIITATYSAASLNSFEKQLNVKFAGINEMKMITIKGEVLTADAFAKTKTPASKVTAKSKTKTITRKTK